MVEGTGERAEPHMKRGKQSGKKRERKKQRKGQWKGHNRSDTKYTHANESPYVILNINFHLLTLAHRCDLSASYDLTCKRGSVGQSEGLSIPRSSVRFRQNPTSQIPMDLNFIDPQTSVINYC